MDFGNNIHYVMIISPGLETHSYLSINVSPETFIFSSFYLVSCQYDGCEISLSCCSLTLQSLGF